MTDLAYAEDILILSSSYSEMQGLLEAVNRHAAAVGMRINASKTKVMSALNPGEQRQAVLEDVHKFKYLGSMFVANGQGTEEIRGKMNLARSSFYNPVFDHGVKYRCVQRPGSTRLKCAQFYSTVARHGLYE